MPTKLPIRYCVQSALQNAYSSAQRSSDMEHVLLAEDVRAARKCASVSTCTAPASVGLQLLFHAHAITTNHPMGAWAHGTLDMQT